MDVYLKNNRFFYNNLKKYINKMDCVHLVIGDLDIVNDSFISDDYDDELKLKIYMVHAVNIKNIKERYNYIYDISCKYLDYAFRINNWCNFKDNKCIGVLNNCHCNESLNGCCYGSKRGLCKNYINGECGIQSLSCKLFSCKYLRKNKKVIKINDICLLKYYFNNKQKFIIEYSFFKDKDEVIELLLQNRKTSYI